MKQIHDNEKKQFQELFKQQKIDKYKERFKILEVFLSTENHITIEELGALLEKNKMSFDKGFLKNTLELMCRYGFAQSKQFDNGDIRYEHMHLGQHHDHMICTMCGKIIEFKNDQLEELQKKIAGINNFYMLQHKMDIYGLCSKCFDQTSQPIPLNKSKAGQKFQITDFNGGSKLNSRLNSMGLKKGDFIEILTNQGKGQLVLSRENTRLVIGRGVAEKIIAKPVTKALHSKLENKELNSEEDITITFLNQMSEGESGIIEKIGGSSLLRRRILEMGLVKGTKIYVEKYAPLKDPIEITAKGYHLSLRVDEAAEITIKRIK